MFSIPRNRTISIVSSFLFGSLVVTTAAAQSPCVSSPEGFKSTAQMECPRCRPSLCDLSCFSCEDVATAAASCDKPKSCTSKISLPNVSITVGDGGSNNCEKMTKTGWAMKDITGTANVEATCEDGKVASIQEVTFSASDAKAAGKECQWSYENLRVEVMWKAGFKPSVSITGPRWSDGAVKITDLAATSNGANFSLTGKAAAPLAGGTGFHQHAAVNLQLPVTASCSCN